MDVLKLAVDSGIIDMETIHNLITMNEKRKYLEMHNHDIWQGKDGYFYTYLDNEEMKRARQLVRKKDKDAVERAVVQYYKSQIEEPLFRDMFNEWVDSKIRYGEIQKQTYDRYKTDYRRYIEAAPLAKMKMKDVTTNYLEDFIKSNIHDNNMSAKAWGNLRTIIIGTVKHAYHLGHTEIHISTFMSDLELSSRSFRKVIMVDEEQVFTEEEIAKIKEEIRSNETSLEKLGVLLALHTGLRAGEVAALKFSDYKDGVLTVNKTQIRYANDEGVLVREIRENTKGRDGIRKVVLTDEAKKVIDRIKNINGQNEYMFYKNGKIIFAEIFTQHLKRVCKHVGIRPRSMHKLRKTYATTLLNAGVDEKIIEKQMGHTNIETTKNYYYYNNRNVEQIKDVLERAMGYE